MSIREKPLHSWRVKKEEEGISLLLFLRFHLPSSISQKKIKRMLDHNLVEVNGKVERFGREKIKEEDHIQLFQEKEKKSFQIKENLLYEDDDFLIFNKPEGITSEGTGLQDLLEVEFGSLFLVHRLDKQTTGAIIFAKNKETEKQFLELFRNQKISKEYIAIVEGIVKDKEGMIDIPLIAKKKYEGQTIYGPGKREEGAKTSLTFWKKMGVGKETSFLSCFPKTGRTHQIRVHLKEIGHPILGDIHYTRKYPSYFRPHRFLLHSFRLQFSHPKTGKKVDVKAPIPDDFKKALQDLKIMVQDPCIF